MNESRKRLTEKSNTVEYLLANKKGQLPDSHQVKVAILGSGYTGVAVAVSLLFKVRNFNHLLSIVNCISTISTIH